MKNIESKLLHTGYTPEKANRPMAIPVERTTAYKFNSSKQAANLFALKELGNIYTRLTNSTLSILEQRMSAIEMGAAAVATASGTSAIFYSIINIASCGDNIVSSKNLYGGTFTMFNDILPKFGITTSFVAYNDLDGYKSAIDSKTRAIFIETIDNPGLNVSDVEKIAKIAHEKNIPLIVDNTFATPYLFNPITHGADIVVHSLSKWINGHGTGIGGIVIDSGKFDWSKGNFPLMNEPDASYHDITWSKDLGDLNNISYALKLRTGPLRNLGACLSPDNAWLGLQGLETLHLRMERHSSNAQQVTNFLKKHKNVSWVNYPGDKGHKSYKNAIKYFKKGFGGMVVFGTKGGIEKGEQFINKLNLFSHVANVGDSKSLAIHPASTTHSQLTKEQQAEVGITEDLIRLSIGIENIEDIIEDLTQALI